MTRPLSRAVQAVVRPAMFRLVALAGDAPSTEASPMPTEAMLTAGTIQPGRPEFSTAVALNQDAERVDAIAGSEFVDDRIRLRE